jgi:hypothetical protein
MDRFTLANETSYLANRAQYSPASWTSATVNNGQYGYVFQGQNPGTYSSLRRINFASDTSIIPASFATWSGAVISGGIRMGAGAQDTTHGYFFGGYKNTPIAMNSAMLRLTFANDSTTASPYTTSYPVNGVWYNTTSVWGVSPAPTTFFMCGVMGTAQNRNHVWLNARAVSTHPAPFANANWVVSNIFRFTFANNLNQFVTRGYFNYQMDGPSGFSTEDYGYWAGQYIRGGTPAATYSTYAKSNIQRLDFSNDTANALNRNTDPLGTLHEFGTHCQMSDPNYAWLTGGQTGYPAIVRSSIIRMSFADDTSALSDRGSLSSNRMSHANFSY